MTNEEFNKLTRRARKKYPKITQKERLKLKQIYKKLGEQLSKEVIKAEAAGLSELTIHSKNDVITQLDIAVETLNKSITEGVNSAVSSAVSIEDRITTDYIMSAVSESGAGTLIKQAGLERMNVALRQRVISSTVTRVFQDGYTFSERVWNASALYKKDMINVILLGQAQGKDNIKIAEAIGVYLKGERKDLKRAKVYGKLKKGSGKIFYRLSKKTDYRALRLVRSEEYISLQDSAVQRGENNPACIEFNWILNTLFAHTDECGDIAANNPYKGSEVPGYPHSNCLCTIEQILRPRSEFITDLKEWSGGGHVEYLDTWYTDKYLA